MGLWYPKDSKFELIAYSDADHVGCKDDCKSTSGGLQFLGGKLVSWSSKKQDCTAMSTAEAEYVSLSAYCAQEHVEKGTMKLYFVGTEYQLVDLFTKALPKERFEYLVHRIVIIMAQQQHASDVHPDELYPPNKRYDIMDANKKCCCFFLCTMDLYGTVLAYFEGRRIKDSRMYAEVFGLDVPLTQSQPTESTQGTHRILSTPRSPNPKMDIAESSALKRSTVIRFCLPKRRSTRLTPPALMPIVDKADEMILQDTLQVSLVENISREEQEARENVELVNKYLASEEIENKMEGSENVIDDSLPPSNDEPKIPGTRLEPRSDKESPKVEITKDEDVEITNVVIPVNVNDEEDEITDEVYELKRREKGKIIEESRNTLQVSLAEHKSQEEQEARENMELVKEHLASVEIENMVEGSENIIDDSLLHRNDEPKIPDTREKGKIVEESRSTPFPTPIRSPRIHTDLVSSDTEKLQELTETGRYTYLFEHLKARFLSRKSFDTLADHLQEVMVESLPTMVDTYIKEQVKKQVPEQAEISSQIQNTIDNHIPSQVNASVRSYMSGNILHVHPVQSQTPSVPEQQYQLYLSMKNDTQLQQQDIAIWLALQMKFENLQVPQTTCRPSAVRPRDQDDPHDDAHPEGENSAKRHKTSEYEAYVSGESSSGQVNEEERGPSTSGNQEQVDDYDFWTDSYASDDDKIPMKQVSQDILEEVSLTIDEAKLKKMVDEMLRQICTSGDEHQYHIDQMRSFLKSDIIWESRKEILVSPHPRKTTPLVQNCQRDPEAPAQSLINQDLLYLKKGSLGPEKIGLSLHKFPAIIFNDDDIEERTSRWVNKCVKKFNPYARYGVEHWKNPHAKIFYINKQKEPRKTKEEVYSNSKIIQPDYKNLNKNDIEDMYLLIMNGKVPDYAETGLLWSLSVFIRSSVIWERVHDFQLGIESYQQKVNLTAPTISFPGVEKHKMFSIIYEPVHGIIYKNSKKEKRVMRHSEIHKFCDATLIRVLEGLKSYNNDVKYGYVQRELTNDEVEYLKLFEEEIEVVVDIVLSAHANARRWYEQKNQDSKQEKTDTAHAKAFKAAEKKTHNSSLR
ncbi:hypothetical protein Tco_0553704 [Tanacetum coccineum]